jgi:hypothetical protein
MSKPVPPAPILTDASSGVHLASAASDFFGPPPLLAGEEKGDYEALLARFTTDVQPTDVVEEIWVRDVVDLVWDAFRLRRLKAKFLEAAAHEGVKEILGPRLESDITAYGLAGSLARGWARRERDAVKRVNGVLAGAGLTMDSVMAQTLAKRLDEVERIDRMIASCEARRNAVLREIDRHRLAFNQRLRHSAKEAEDAEFEVVQPVKKGGESR